MRHGAALLVLLACACTRDPSFQKCTRDDECGVDGVARCEVESGRCACVDDRACNPSELCNGEGYCQRAGGCASSDDCPAEAFCFETQCIDRSVCDDDGCCSSDATCPFGKVCDLDRTACVEGCVDDADCAIILGEVCVGAFVGVLGHCGLACEVPCARGLTQDPTTCECIPNPALCEPCTVGAAGQCGAPANHCLPGGFCGVDCLNGGACPDGFACVDVTVPLTATACSVSADDCAERVGRAGSCRLEPARPCASTTDCLLDGDECVLISCASVDGDDSGFCTCARDDDCFDDRCLDADAAGGVPGRCEISGLRCFEDLDCDIITCVDGGCRIGKNCAPANGDCAD